MRKLIASAFVSLDGIMQAPGGPEEDPTGNFSMGGWMFNYMDENMDISASGPLTDFDHRCCDEYLCTKRRYPARYLSQCRAQQEGAGST